MTVQIASLWEQAPAPFQEAEAHNKGVPGEAMKPDEEPKVKRVRFVTPEHIHTHPSQPSPVKKHHQHLHHQLIQVLLVEMMPLYLLSLLISSNVE